MTDRADTSPDPAHPGGRPRPTAARVRHARPEDLDRVAELAADHAAYEKAAPPAPGLADRLARLLFGPEPPRLRCLVAELPDGRLGAASKPKLRYTLSTAPPR